MTEVETLVSIQQVLDMNVLYDAWSESAASQNPDGGQPDRGEYGKESHTMVGADGSLANVRVTRDGVRITDAGGRA